MYANQCTLSPVQAVEGNKRIHVNFVFISDYHMAQSVMNLRYAAAYNLVRV
jgi:hypothetical protein